MLNELTRKSADSAVLSAPKPSRHDKSNLWQTFLVLVKEKQKKNERETRGKRKKNDRETRGKREEKKRIIRILIFQYTLYCIIHRVAFGGGGSAA